MRNAHQLRSSCVIVRRPVRTAGAPESSADSVHWRSFVDPLADDGDFGILQFGAERHGRLHRAGEPAEQCAFIGLAGNDRRAAESTLEGSLAGAEVVAGHLLGSAVAARAVLVQDLESLLGCRLGEGGKGQAQNEPDRKAGPTVMEHTH